MPARGTKRRDRGAILVEELNRLVEYVIEVVVQQLARQAVDPVAGIAEQRGPVGTSEVITLIGRDLFGWLGKEV